MNEFSFSKGTRICKVVESKLKSENGTEIFLYDPDFRCCIKCSDRCTLSKPCCKECSKFLYHKKQQPKLNVDKLYEYLKYQKIESDSDSDSDGDGDSDSDVELPRNRGNEIVGAGVSTTDIKLRSGRFQLVPTSNLNNPDTIYICGAAGSGKSFYIAQYLSEFIKYYPKYRIYLFSQKTEDKHLDSLITKRIPLDKLPEANFEAEDFKSTMVIFDDIDVISDKKINTATFELVDKILEIGRSYQTFCLMTMHLASNREQTKRILNRCTHFVFFKKSAGRNLKYALENYLNFEPKEIRQLLRYDTNSYCIFRTCPQIILLRNELFFQSKLDPDN